MCIIERQVIKAVNNMNVHIAIFGLSSSLVTVLGKILEKLNIAYFISEEHELMERKMQS